MMEVRRRRNTPLSASSGGGSTGGGGSIGGGGGRSGGGSDTSALGPTKATARGSGSGGGTATTKTASRSATRTNTNNSTMKRKPNPKLTLPPPKLMTITETDQLFRIAVYIAIFVWIFLLAFCYAIATPDDIEYLNGNEQMAAAAASAIFLVSISLSCLPILLRKAAPTTVTQTKISGILFSLLVIQSIAFCTNALLAFAPVVVIRDPYTKARVFFIRWCEWIPLSGLMTFLSEGIDLKVDRRGYGIAIPFLVGLGQSLSCLCGIILPFCYRFPAWSLVMFLSFVFYLTIFPRLYEKQQYLKTQSIGYTVSEVETYARIKTGYDLLYICSMFWTFLVIIYFIPMIGMYLPENHFLHDDSLAMILDTFFDVLAKCLYMRIILEVHGSVFDSEGRTRRHLSELRKMMSALWETSSDVIVISVRSGDRATTMLSPTFATMVGATTTPPSMALMVETTITSSAFVEGGLPVGDEDDIDHPTQVYFVDATTIPYPADDTTEIRTVESMMMESNHPDIAKHSDVLVREARNITNFLWKYQESKSTTTGTTSTATSSDSNTDPKEGTAATATTDDVAAPSSSSGQEGTATRTTTGGRQSSRGPSGSETLFVHEVIGVDGAKIQCEIKLTRQKMMSGTRNAITTSTSNSGNAVSSVLAQRQQQQQQQQRERGGQHDNSVSHHHDTDTGGATIAIVRDVTERYLRFEAERRAHSEALARQKDAQTVNRFTRHEIKNGLLAGIEVCDYLSNAMKDMKAGFSDSDDVDRQRGWNNSEGSITNTFHSNSPPTPSKPKVLMGGSGHHAGFSRYVNELEGTLHEILDTVLAEAMARDVVHEVYQPKLERVDVLRLIKETTKLHDSSGSRDRRGMGGGGGDNSKIGGVESGIDDPTSRFKVRIVPSDMPLLSMDPQLLKYIHRNAVSNACKYGAKNGVVLTDVRYHVESKEFELDVVNEPGEMNEKLMSMGNRASEWVFQQGKRLHDSDDISSGDGAWIMQRCAKTCGGFCSIRFERTQTIFSFRCSAEPYANPWENFTTFEVPTGTWGIGLDDSTIQRRLLSRVLTHVGVESSRRIVCGKTPEEAEGIVDMMIQSLRNHPNNYVLALIDENLDYSESHGRRLIGSKLIEQVLGQLKPSEERRLLALIRSANDSAEDVSSYKARAHGFFPKASMRKERAREILAPLWKARFPNPDIGGTEDSSESGGPHSNSNVMSDLITREELIESLSRVQQYLAQTEKADWPSLWSKLHILKGDLMVTENNDAAIVAEGLINDLRGGDNGKVPADFDSIWENIQAQVHEAAELLESS